MNFLDIGINMIRGYVVEALIALAIKLQENSITWPSLLASTLSRFATDEHPAIRAVVLRRLTYLQYLQPEFGWELFDLAMQNQSRELWKIAEPCLYYAYHQKFEKIYPWLEKIYREGSDEDLQVWGRISALCSLSQKINNDDFIKKLSR